MRIPTLPSWMFEILAGPALVWLWFCAKMCGGTVEYAVDETDDLTSQE